MKQKKNTYFLKVQAVLPDQSLAACIEPSSDSRLLTPFLYLLCLTLLSVCEYNIQSVPPFSKSKGM